MPPYPIHAFVEHSLLKPPGSSLPIRTEVETKGESWSHPHSQSFLVADSSLTLGDTGSFETMPPTTWQLSCIRFKMEKANGDLAYCWLEVREMLANFWVTPKILHVWENTQMMQIELLCCGWIRKDRQSCSCTSRYHAAPPTPSPVPFLTAKLSSQPCFFF